jgi:hypothetical protein
MKFTHDATFSFYCDEIGNAYATRNGLRRLVGVEFKTTQLDKILGQGENYIIQAEILTAGGLQRGALINVDGINEVVAHYAEKGVPMAKKTAKQLMKVGTTVFLQDKAEFNRAHKTVKPLFNWLDLRERAIQVNLLIMNTCPEAFDALNVAYFGIPCRTHKEARVIQPEAVYENLPDYVDTDELQELLYLREQFNRTRGKMPDRITKAVKRTAKVYNR